MSSHSKCTKCSHPAKSVGLCHCLFQELEPLIFYLLLVISHLTLLGPRADGINLHDLSGCSHHTAALGYRADGVAGSYNNLVILLIEIFACLRGKKSEYDIFLIITDSSKQWGLSRSSEHKSGGFASKDSSSPPFSESCRFFSA